MARAVAERLCLQDRKDFACAEAAFLAREPSFAPGPPCTDLPEADGEAALTRDQIAAVARWHVPELTWCYELELKRSPYLAGRLTVLFTVGCDGTIRRQHVEHSDLPSEVKACILDQLSAWRFPPDPTGQTQDIAYPFIFGPSKD